MAKPVDTAPEQAALPALTPGALAKKLIIPVLLVGGLAAAAALLLDMRHLGQLLLTARLWPLTALLACHVASIYVHSLRMHVLLRRATSFSTVFHANNICNMVNSVLPLRAGEFAMALIVSRRANTSGAEVLSNILVDRLLALISILAIFLVTLPGFSPHGAAALTLAHNWIYYALVFGGIVLAILLVTRLERQLLVLARAMLTRLPVGSPRSKERLLDRVQGLISGLRVLFHLRTSVPVFLLCLCTWSCIIALNYFGMLSVIEAPSLTAAVFVTFLTIVGIMLVATPSGVGTVHGAAVLALSMFGVGAEQALAFGILSHALVTVTNISLGLWSAHSVGFRMGEAMRIE